MGKPDEPLHDLEWLSGYLGGIPVRTIYNWRQHNEGPARLQVGKYLRYRRSDVETWLDSRRDEAHSG